MTQDTEPGNVSAVMQVKPKGRLHCRTIETGQGRQHILLQSLVGKLAGADRIEQHA